MDCTDPSFFPADEVLSGHPIVIEVLLDDHTTIQKVKYRIKNQLQFPKPLQFLERLLPTSQVQLLIQNNFSILMVSHNSTDYCTQRIAQCVEWFIKRVVCKWNIFSILCMILVWFFSTTTMHYSIKMMYASYCWINTFVYIQYWSILCYRILYSRYYNF